MPLITSLNEAALRQLNEATFRLLSSGTLPGVVLVAVQWPPVVDAVRYRLSINGKATGRAIEGIVYEETIYTAQRRSYRVFAYDADDRELTASQTSGLFIRSVLQGHVGTENVTLEF
jgi:hypothetical protein